MMTYMISWHFRDYANIIYMDKISADSPQEALIDLFKKLNYNIYIEEILKIDLDNTVCRTHGFNIESLPIVFNWRRLYNAK